ncbi:MAG: SDR family NAD(P)-dependent oxidoreductase [Anaerolineae bacterium]|nr:SDR family NAD(P)-dependent oxidoreductase [Anaerolineae bacterium]
MRPLAGQIAVVTGASRGVGKGIALGLGEAGATVYVTGRSVREGEGRLVGEELYPLAGTVHQTAEEVTAQGGRGIALPCDHRDDAQVEAAFARVLDEQEHIDILVNNVWGGYENMAENRVWTWDKPFWQQPLWRWDAMFQAGVRAHFTASRLAAPSMVERQRGLIVNISYFAGQKYLANTLYGVAKCATDRLAMDMAHELRPYGVAAVSLYPGLVRTEGVMSAAEWFDLSNSESPQFQGRAVAALAADPKRMEKSGQVLVTAALALEYGFTDIDGQQPRPLTLEEA